MHYLYKIITIFIACVSIILYFLTPNDINGQILCILLVLVSFIPIILSWKQKDILFIVIYLFIFFYSIVPIQYYFGGGDVSSVRIQCQTSETVYNTALSIIFFYLAIIWGQWGNNKSSRYLRFENKLPINNNIAGYVVCLIVAIICIIFGKSGATILTTGSYAETLKESDISSLYAYGIIPILIGMQFANSRKKINIILSLAAIYVIKDLLYGGRIDSIQLCLGLYVLYFRFKWSIKQTITILGISFIMLLVYGLFRNSVSIGLVGALTEVVSNMGQSAHHSDVYYSSMRLFYLIDNSILNLENRIDALFNFILSIFIPYSILPPIANLSKWHQDIASSGGGGLFSVFMVTMLGWGGMAIFSYYLGRSFRKFQYLKGSNFFTFWVILTIIMTPRWYAYYPIAIFKFSLYGAVMYYLLNTLFLSKKISK